MPLSGSIGQKAGGNSFTPIVTNNNAFNVKIVPLDGSMEEKPNQQVDTKTPTIIKVGDMVSGEIIKDGGKRIGKVVAVQKEGESIVGYKILDEDGEEVILDPSTTKKYITNDGGEDPTDSNRSVIGESFHPTKSSSFFPTFKEWSNSLESGY